MVQFTMKLVSLLRFGGGLNSKKNQVKFKFHKNKFQSRFHKQFFQFRLTVIVYSNYGFRIEGQFQIRNGIVPMTSM